MPEMDGLMAAKEIRKLQPNIKIIAQTAYALEIDKAKYREIFNEYVTKPINVKDLKYKMSTVMVDKKV
jgi:CheY-like chemotaxis protein